MSEVFGFDAYSPKEIAARVENVGVVKARLPLIQMLMLGTLAGGFIGLGAIYFVVIKSDSSLGFAMSQTLGGLAFSLGLILVIVAGAELFTGNNLLVMAWADGKIATSELLKNWVIICGANCFGALGLALVVVLSGHLDMNDGAIREQYLKIAAAKSTLPFWEAFFRGVLCNILVCLAVWMALAGRTVVDKIAAIIFPISALVAAGLEHSVANMYFLLVGIFIKASGYGSAIDAIGMAGFFRNLVPVILGNLVGGGLLVGLVYYLIYLRKDADKQCILPCGIPKINQRCV